VRDDLELPTISADRMRNAADGVLNQPEYLESARPPSLRERLIDWVVEFFVEVFRSLTTVGGRGVFAWVIIGLFVVGILFMLTRFRRVGATRRVRHSGPKIEVERDLTADQWRAHASQLEAEGDWRGGLRCRHRALVADLIDRESISARPGQTAGEVSRTIARSIPAAADNIDAATRLFADTWYGGRTATAQTRDQFEGHSQRVLAAIDAQRRESGDAAPTKPESVMA